MEKIKILKNRVDVNWDYNEEKDIFYLSLGKSQTAISMDIGEGLIVHYDETQKEVIGLTLTGLREKVLKKLDKEISSDREAKKEDKKSANAEHKAAEKDEESAAYGKQLFDQGGEA